MAIELPRPVGFVLGGGGTLGAMQAGMLQALHEAGVRPDLVVGTSVGALNGALLADDPEHAAERLVTTWSSIRRGRVFPGGTLRQLRTLYSSRTFLFDSDGLASLAASLLRAQTFDQLRVPFGAVATDAETAAPVLLTRGLVVPAIVASAALPGIFPPVWHNGSTLYDGGLSANVPLRQAMTMGAQSLVVLDCSYPGQSWQLPDSITEVLAFVLTVSARQQASYELPVVSAEVPVVYLPGPKHRRVNPLGFAHTAELVEEAYVHGREFLGRLTVDGPGLYGSLHARPAQVERGVG